MISCRPCAPWIREYVFHRPDKIAESPFFFAISLFFHTFPLDILTFFHTFAPS